MVSQPNGIVKSVMIKFGRKGVVLHVRVWKVIEIEREAWKADSMLYVIYYKPTEPSVAETRLARRSRLLAAVARKATLYFRYQRNAQFVP